MLALTVSSGGCRDDFNAGDDDAGTTGDGDGDGDANLLFNGSFEEWGGGAPTAWVADAAFTVTESTKDPHDGDKVVALDATEYAQFEQLVGLPEPLAADGSLAVELAYRWTAGDMTAPGIDLYGVLENDEEILLPPVTPPPFVQGQWKVGGGSIKLPEAIVGVRVVVVGGGNAAQAFDVDSARLWVP